MIKLTSALLKPLLGIGLADAQMQINPEQWDAIQEQVALAKDVLADAAEFAKSEAEDAAKKTEDVEHPDLTGPTAAIARAEGGILRSLHLMLKKEDRTFADLRRVANNNGRYLWVHSRFVSIYQPPLPDIPT